MKRLVAGIMGVLAMLAIAGVGVQAAPAVDTTAAVGPYEGVFYGYVHGDKDSKAPLILVLTHRGNQVQGDVYLGEGLYVYTGLAFFRQFPEGVPGAYRLFANLVSLQGSGGEPQ